MKTLQDWQKFWDERYRQAEYVYGERPNAFFAQELARLPLPPGKALFPAEGEGRNAVHAASKGWEVTAFDLSQGGKEKALQLAERVGVSIRYEVCSLEGFDFAEASYDLIVGCYTHFEPAMRQLLHQQMIYSLKPGGIVIYEAFDKAQLGNTSGGPKSLDMLYSQEMLKTDFAALDISSILQCTVLLEEGSYHEGEAEVVRMMAQKPFG